MSNNKFASDLTVGKIFPKLVRFAIPFVLANLLQTVYTIIDAIIVGNFVGSNGLSAVTSGGELIHLYIYIAIGFGAAGQTIIGQYAGAKEQEKINETIGTLFTFLMTLGIAVTIFNLFTTRWQLEMMRLPAEAMEEGISYVIICSMGMIFSFGYNLLSSILRGLGDARHPLIFIGIASGINLVLDLLFVSVFQMGVTGAAFATVIGQGVSFVISVIYLYRKRQLFCFDFKLKSFIPRKKIMAMICKIGIPMTLQYVSITLSMLYIASLINRFDVYASAANGITLKLTNVLRIVTNSLNVAGSAMVAQNIGADKKERVPEIFRCVFILAIISGILYAAILVFFPVQIFALFNREPGVLSYAPIYSGIGALTIISCALHAPVFAVVKGSGAAVIDMIAAMVDGVFARIGLSLLFGNVLDMGVTGYWLGSMLASYVTFLILFPYYLSGAWKKKKIIER